MPDAANRFAHWPKLPARLASAVLAALLVLAAIVPVKSGEGVHSGAHLSAAKAKARDDDLQLYDNVIARLQRGENYYDAVAIEHRASNYPLRPGFAVRLPTLAVILAHVPLAGQVAASILLVIATLLAWFRRLGEEPGALPVRTMAMAALFVGVAIGTTRYFFVLHELWAGTLLALSMGLHRPDKGKWVGALLAAAAALAIREHALPFVLLMAAFALWHRRWREGVAWVLLVLAFLAAMAVHLHTVAELVRPSDPMGPSWLTLRGLSGWTSMIVLSSNLRFLPTLLAGPLVVLMVFGWAGWRSSAGAFATLLYLGYGLAFMIAGRADNWYWGMTVAPTMFAGLAFVPMAAKGLWSAAFPLATAKPLAQG